MPAGGRPVSLVPCGIPGDILFSALPPPLNKSGTGTGICTEFRKLPAFLRSNAGSSTALPAGEFQNRPKPGIRVPGQVREIAREKSWFYLTLREFRPAARPPGQRKVPFYLFTKKEKGPVQVISGHSLRPRPHRGQGRRREGAILSYETGFLRSM
jgi:hypothetical protein